MRRWSLGGVESASGHNLVVCVPGRTAVREEWHPSGFPPAVPSTVTWCQTLQRNPVLTGFQGASKPRSTKDLVFIHFFPSRSDLMVGQCFSKILRKVTVSNLEEA